MPLTSLTPLLNHHTLAYKAKKAARGEAAAE